MLYVNGQDIKRITFAFLQMPFDAPMRTVDVGPEHFLEELDRFLKDNHKSVREVKQIVAVVGPGSATSLRAALSILNTMRFVAAVELIGIEKDVLETDADAVARMNRGDFTPVSRDAMLIPLYAHAPRITASTKDHLRR